MMIPAIWVFCMLFTMFHIGRVETQVEESYTVNPSFTTVTGRKETFGDTKLFVYKNIPYAKSLTNLSRFEPPVALSEPTETMPDKMAPCPQLLNRPKIPDNGNIIGEEDCLLLDVYSTQPPQNQKLPVFVYFHGGNFSNGHKDEYAPSYLMQEKDMIVVIPNYRLGVLGFLSTQDMEIPGNMGLLDQQMALRWVYENIELFGGNKSHVTIGGHGAGGVSASLHILSTGSQNYFSAAITASGTAMDPWALSKRSRESAEDLAKQVSCPTSSSKSMVRCLRDKPLEDLLNAQRTLHNITFCPVVDGVFLTDKPEALYLKQKQEQKQSVPLLAGVTKDESSIEVFTEFDEASKGGHLDTMLAHLMFRYLDGTNNIDSVIKAAKYHYLRGITAPDLISMHESFINLMTDFLYVSGMVRTLTAHTPLNSNVWMYVFQVLGQSLGKVFGPDDDKYNLLYGASHMDDVIYLFNTTFADWMWTNRDMKPIITRYSKIWKNFIVTRELSPSDTWSFSTKKYIEFTGKFDSPKLNYKPEEMDFWNLFVPDLQSVNSSSEHYEPQITESKLSTTNWGVAGLAITLAVLCVALAGTVVVMRKQIARRCIAAPSDDRKTSGV